METVETAGFEGSGSRAGSRRRGYARARLSETAPNPTTGVEDPAVVLRVAAGDLDALGDLYARYGRMVYAIAFRVLGESGATEECVQDVFMELWRHASRYNERRGRVSTWLCTIARNRAIDIARSQQRRALPDGALEATGEAVDVADLVEAADLAVRVAEAIAALPQPQLEVVQLAHFNGLTQSEIAARLGVPLGTVKSRMRAGLAELRGVANDLRSEDTR